MSPVQTSLLTTVIPALCELPRQELETIARNSHIVTLTPGQTLYREGDLCNYHILVISGSLRVQKVSDTGQEVVLYHLTAGQRCHLTDLCLIGGEHYSAEARSESETRVLMIAKPCFHQLLNDIPAFRQLIFREIKQSIGSLLNLVHEIAFDHVDHRIAALLLRIRDQHDSVATTHQQLATELGTAREVVSRVLKEFEKRHWVQLHRGRIDLLAPHQLEKI